ncbi:MAG TPA: hypothetical protein VM491_24755 [Burkholderiaceae bacterium]|nr:hypothetical protein [Burkholderiaceae bacterium]
MDHELIAVFEQSAQASAARERMVAAGFADSDLAVRAARGPQDDPRRGMSPAMDVEDYQVQTLWSLFDIQPQTEPRTSGADRGTELSLRVHDEADRDKALELMKECGPVQIVEVGWTEHTPRGVDAD